MDEDDVRGETRTRVRDTCPDQDRIAGEVRAALTRAKNYTETAECNAFTIYNDAEIGSETETLAKAATDAATDALDAVVDALSALEDLADDSKVARERLRDAWVGHVMEICSERDKALSDLEDAQGRIVDLERLLEDATDVA